MMQLLQFEVTGFKIGVNILVNILQLLTTSSIITHESHKTSHLNLIFDFSKKEGAKFHEH